MAPTRAPQSRSQQGAPQQPAGGTMGGLSGLRPRSGQPVPPIGDAGYLWILVLLEIAAMGWLRHAMRRYHGG